MEAGSESEPQVQPGMDLHSSLFLNIKSLGTVFGKQGKDTHALSRTSSLIVCPRYNCTQDIYPQGNYCRPKDATVPCHRQKYERREGSIVFI